MEPYEYLRTRGARSENLEFWRERYILDIYSEPAKSFLQKSLAGELHFYLCYPVRNYFPLAIVNEIPSLHFLSLCFRLQLMLTAKHFVILYMKNVI